MMLLRFCLYLIPLLLLVACASGPTFETSGVDRALSPRDVTAKPQPAMGQTVLWGGVILTTTNLKDSTQIEVLAYPLDTDESPLLDSAPLGRFILEQTGYLEPASYAEGRQISVTGTVTGTRVGRVGESDYDYAVISARQLYLWPMDAARDQTRVIFGIGVGYGF
jgi:outer membrane lipoprotein